MKDKKSLGRLTECSRQSCRNVLFEGEQERVLSKEDDDSDITMYVLTCPKCGNDSFYILNAAGQKKNTREAFDPATIDPSPRLGLKMKRRILAAKRRGIQHLES